MSNSKQHRPCHEVILYGRQVNAELHEAELRQWTVYLPDLLPALLQSIEEA
ncbi:hypothetical protein [uncultured Aquitalea sp.]|uniref:hypothetical protein n=1 Tax=uncultured Aquitalea sp. TaxID=540272 RepID=UPI0025F060B1|nr:hypothetical protein [uncultured Aquitalea sp.]